MLKITFLGAGSTVFARNVLGDCLSSETLRECEIALYDIDPSRLKESEVIINAINKGKGDFAKISSYVGLNNLKEALQGASFVINAVQVGGYDPCTITDFEIPKKYGAFEISRILFVAPLISYVKRLISVSTFEDELTVSYRFMDSKLFSRLISLLRGCFQM